MLRMVLNSLIFQMEEPLNGAQKEYLAHEAMQRSEHIRRGMGAQLVLARD